MKQFKAERQNRLSSRSVEEDNAHTLDHLISQHNALCDYLAEGEAHRKSDLELVERVLAFNEKLWAERGAHLYPECP